MLVSFHSPVFSVLLNHAQSFENDDYEEALLNPDILTAKCLRATICFPDLFPPDHRNLSPIIEALIFLNTSKNVKRGN